ncbi:MAG TPA: M20/M25/M40 family metallo-hydrolase, partial [Firmicutes bacterium]|nr:M20/M25/M40 family metallo-hydrolase [Bacillota bacterium]
MSKAPEEILGDLIRIDSTNPPGNETAVALYLKKLFSEAGINSRIIEPEEGRGSFIARLGSGEKKLLFLAHTDVVPAGDGWDFEPFSGEVKNGVVHGRGALDCKDLVAAQVSAALQLLEEKFPFTGELIIAATADEERGGRFGVGYLAAEMPELLKADYAVNEGADQPITVNGKMVYFLQVGEKGAAWCRLKTRGRAGHGSIPTLADNAVVRMARAVDQLGRYHPETILIPEVEKLMHSLADLCAIEIRDLSPGMIDRLLDELPLEKAFIEALRSMTRMT